MPRLGPRQRRILAAMRDGATLISHSGRWRLNGAAVPAGACQGLLYHGWIDGLGIIEDERGWMQQYQMTEQAKKVVTP